MAGYSGTPLPEKLGIKEHFHTLLLDPPADVKAELKTKIWCAGLDCKPDSWTSKSAQ
jgi:hypothetical protein